MPVAGPTAALVVGRSLERRRREALYVGLGAALPEAFYALVASWGLSAIVTHFPEWVRGSRIVSGLVIAVVGVYLARQGGRAKRARSAERPKWSKVVGWRNALLGFSMTIANPTLLVSWSVVVGALHSAGLLRPDERSAPPFAVGVGFGVAGWFAVLVGLLHRFRDHVPVRTVTASVRIVGGVLVVVGLALAARYAVGV